MAERNVENLEEPSSAREIMARYLPPEVMREILEILGEAPTKDEGSPSSEGLTSQVIEELLTKTPTESVPKYGPIDLNRERSC